jgi:conjugal transfer pilus assembly protein TraF
MSATSVSSLIARRPFSDIWQRAAWQNPDIDYTCSVRSRLFCKRAWTDNRAATRDQGARALAAGWMFYFAQSQLPVRSLSLILVLWLPKATHHRGMAVSTDGVRCQFLNHVVGQRPVSVWRAARNAGTGAVRYRRAKLS